MSHIKVEIVRGFTSNQTFVKVHFFSQKYICTHAEYIEQK